MQHNSINKPDCFLITAAMACARVEAGVEDHMHRDGSDPSSNLCHAHLQSLVI
jgi:hypothetical protein